MSADATIGVGVIGLGFMGHIHIRAYQAARDAGYHCRLVAVCDRDPQCRAGRASGPWNLGAGAAQPLFDPDTVRTYADPAGLLADDAVDVVSICTYTDTHADLAIRALAAGKHVLVEKPVALRSADVRRVVEAAATAKTLCMPAMCIRFWPGWSWLKQQIAEGTYGAVRSAVLQRLGGVPAWAADFYPDTARSGGALVDLHIHDADFIRWCFGDPAAVVSTGSVDHVTTMYRYPRGPDHVVAEGGWVPMPRNEFRMRYLVAFEHATAEFDMAADPPLTITREGTTEVVRLEGLTGYDVEVRHLLEAIRADRRSIDATVEDAEAVARLLEAERQSLETGLPVRFGS